MKKYQSYKSSGVDWIGDIPEHWISPMLKTYCSIRRGSSPRPIDDPKYFDDNGKYSWVRISDVTKSERYLLETEEKLSELGSSLSTKLEPNDIFVSIAGSVGKPIINKIQCCIHDGFVWFLNLRVEKEFLYYIFKSGQCFSGLGKMGTQLNLNTDTIGMIKFPYPPIQEQLQIVQFLDKKTELIDLLISTKERKIDLLKQQRTTLINELVTKGLNPNVILKDSGVKWIGEIPEHWKMVSIKNLVSTKVTDGPHETPEWVEDGIPFLSVESVKDGKLDFNKKRGFITEELHNIYSKKCKPQRDDIFIVKSGSTTGKSTIVETDEEFNIWSPLCIVRSNKDKILPRFFFSSIQSFYFRRFVELGWSFGTQPNIGMGVIENIQIVVPPLIEQQPIIDFLNHKIFEIDDLVELEQNKIDLLKEYRQSLISDVITGKIDVRTNLN
jgi:type I restriction enzyme S subunit